MVKIENVALAKGLLVLALLGHGARAGIEDVLVSFNTT